MTSWIMLLKLTNSVQEFVMLRSLSHSVRSPTKAENKKNDRIRGEGETKNKNDTNNDTITQIII